MNEEELREKERREVLCGERSIYNTPRLNEYYKKLEEKNKLTNN